MKSNGATQQEPARTAAPRSVGQGQPGVTARMDGAGGSSLEVRSELGTGALQAREDAQVKARFALAKYNPRDMRRVHAAVLADCQREGFAEVAVYRRPVGRRKNDRTGQWEDELIEGLSIRFAEDAKRHMGNMHVASIVWTDDWEKRIVRVSVTDLESNTTEETDVVVPKVIERKDPKDREVLSTRLNSYGDAVYQVICTPDELTTKTNAEVAKARRNKILELLPADLKDAALDACLATTRRAAEAALKDPKKTRLNVIQGFAPVGVPESELVAWLGKDLEKMNATELTELRGLLQALKNSETTWDAIMEARTGIRREKGPKAPAAPPASVPAAATEQPQDEEPPPPTDPEEPQEPAAVVEPTQRDLLASALPPQPVPAPAPTVEPAEKEPSPGTEEFARWLEGKMRAAPDVKTLHALSLRSAKTPNPWPSKLGKLFLDLRNALKKKETTK